MRKYQNNSVPPQISQGFSSNKTGFTQAPAFSKSGAGFTLIELLVVIAVLGVLATVLITIINPAQKLASARDAGRKSALKQIANALESYYVNNGSYPTTSGWISSEQGNNWFSALLVSGDLKVAPLDPINTGCTTTTINYQDDYASNGNTKCFTYAYYSDGYCNLTGKGYLLTAHLESENPTKWPGADLSATGGPGCGWAGSWIPGSYVLTNTQH